MGCDDEMGWDGCGMEVGMGKGDEGREMEER